MSKFSLWNFDIEDMISKHFGLPYSTIKKLVEKEKLKNEKK